MLVTCNGKEVELVVIRKAGIVGTTAKTIMAEIEKSKTCSLSGFMGSLGIKFLGRRQGEIMMKGGIDTLEKFVTLKEADLEKVPGFTIDGSKAREIVLGIKKARPVIKALLEVGVVPGAEVVEEAAPVEGGSLAGSSFCFTGAIEKVDDKGVRYTRSRMQDLVRQNGGSVLDEVRGGLTYLVVADPSSTSSKTTKAKKLGIGLLSEQEFFAMIRM